MGRWSAWQRSIHQSLEQTLEIWVRWKAFDWNGLVYIVNNNKYYQNRSELTNPFKRWMKSRNESLFCFHPALVYFLKPNCNIICSLSCHSAKGIFYAFFKIFGSTQIIFCHLISEGIWKMQGICSHAANDGSGLRLKNLSRKIDGKGLIFRCFFSNPI